MATMAASLGRALWDWAVSGFTICTGAEMAKRLETCGSCDQFVIEETRCRLCGCFLMQKVRMKTEKCPLDKW
jgi:hypothetical protein